MGQPFHGTFVRNCTCQKLRNLLKWQHYLLSAVNGLEIKSSCLSAEYNFCNPFSVEMRLMYKGRNHLGGGTSAKPLEEERGKQ